MPDEPIVDPAATDPEPVVETSPADPPLGDAGQKAIDKMKAEVKAARAEAKAGKDAIAELAAMKDANLNEVERAVKDARAEGETEATKKANARVIRAEIKAAATGKLVDPADALAFVDLDAFELDEDGEIDSAAVAAAIADLIERKPQLAAVPGAPPVPPVPGGPRGEIDPLSVDQQIAEAQAKGDARTVIRLNNQKLAALAASS